MSRKTRKLIWSAPLVAVLAVAGALAIFAALAPDEASAHPSAPAAAHVPPGPVSGIAVAQRTIANGGRTSLDITWNAPTAGDAPTMYRVDVSEDTDVWRNVIGGQAPGGLAPTMTLAESVATSNCASGSADSLRCYTATGLKANTLYHFRVFAINAVGTGPISINETLGSGRTHPIDPPAVVTGLDATDYFEDKIVVSWTDVPDTGGADILWYCIAVMSSPTGAFTDLMASEARGDCLTAGEATPAAVADDKGVYTPVPTGPEGISVLLDDSTVNDASQTIVIAAKDEDGNAVTSYEHLGLHTPDVIELRYRLYAVTSESGDADTTTGPSDLPGGLRYRYGQDGAPRGQAGPDD